MAVSRRCPFHAGFALERNASPDLPVPSPASVRLQRPPRFYRQWQMFTDPLGLICHLVEQYGDFIRYEGALSGYLVNDPALVQTIFADNTGLFSKETAIYRRFRQALGDGLVTAEGDRWRRQRKRIQPVFAPAAIRDMGAVAHDSCRTLITRLRSRILQEPVLDLADEMRRIALEIAGRTLFSNAFENQSADILHWSRVLNAFCGKPPIPILNDPWFPTPSNRAVRSALRDYRRFLHDLIDQRLGATDPGESRDLLSVFLAMKEEGTGEPLPIPAIAEEVLALLVGAHETTAAALTWTLFEIGRNPDSANRVTAEIDAIACGKPLQVDQFQQLSELERTIKESMRLHPPFWFENRKVMRDTRLANAEIRAGSTIVLSRYALHRHPRIWSQADTFDPDRFKESRMSAIPIGAYLPFGYGPRICVGRHFAMMQMKVIIAAILQNFELHLARPASEEMSRP